MFFFFPTFPGGCPGEGEKEEGGGGGEDEPGEGEEGFSSGETATGIENETETGKGCRLLVPGVPEAPSGGTEGGEEEVVGGFAEAEGELKSDKQACKAKQGAILLLELPCSFVCYVY